MKYSVFAFILLFSLMLTGCSYPTPTEPSNIIPSPTSVKSEPTTAAPDTEPEQETQEYATKPQEKPEPLDTDFVKVIDYIPDIAIDLRYATCNNFTGQTVYDFQEPWLRYGTVKKLIKVQARLAKHGFRLKIWDAFRPTAAQFRLWEICPDSTYVANPYSGFSSHSRGNTVDITIIDQYGNEVEMPTGFDDFSKKADRDFSDCTAESAKNAAYLEEIMIECGFSGYYGEWWHYTDTTSYPVEQNFNPTEKE